MTNEQLSQLERLAKLYQDGSLTKEEFEEQKRVVIATAESSSKDTPLVVEDTQTKGLSFNVKLAIAVFVAVCGIIFIYDPHENDSTANQEAPLSISDSLAIQAKIDSVSASSLKPKAR